MKVYHPDGRVYEGEPVDCRELMQVGGYVKTPPGEAEATAPVSKKRPTLPTQSALDDEMIALPAQVKSGAAKDAESTVTSLKSRYGDLFTADIEAAVRILFPTAGKAADATTGGKSAKVAGVVPKKK